MIIKSNNNVFKNYFGNVNVNKVYAGENLVFGHDEPIEIKNYLALTAITDTSIGFFRNMATVDIQYSSDGNNWSQYNLGTNDRMTLPAGETLYFKGNNTSITIGNTGLGYFLLNNINQQVEVSGNAMSLIYGDNFENLTTIPDYGLAGLFKNCYALVSAENLILPATTLATQCYKGMFSNCSKLTTAPVLAATTLVSGCYNQMFSGCSKLNYIKTNFLEWTNGTTSSWVENVSSTGTFVVNSQITWDPYDYIGVNGIPEGWTVIKE